MLKPLPILSCPWTNVILDFVTGLLMNNGYNANLMVLDCWKKEKYYILCTTDKYSTTTEAGIQLLF